MTIWKRVPLADILADGPSNGFSPKSEDGAQGTLTLKLSATTSGKFVLNDRTTKRIHETVSPDSKFWLKPGDVVIQRANSLDYVGTTALFEGPADTYIYPDLMVRLRLKPVADPAFVVAYLNSPSTRAKFRSKATGTTGNMPKINGATIKAIEVPLPPLKVQRAVVSRLTTLKARSSAARLALDAVPPLLEKLRQSIFAAAFRGDLTKDWRAKNPNVEPASVLLDRIRAERRKKWEESEVAKMEAKGRVPRDHKWKSKYAGPPPSQDPNLPELPGGWCWSTVEEVAADVPRSIQSGPFGSSLLHSEFQDSGVLAVGIDNVLDGRFSMGSQNRIGAEKFQQLSRFAARSGDVLVTVMATVGRCCVVPEGLEPAIITKHVYRISPNQRIVAPLYLMNSMRGAPALRDAMKADVRGQTRPGINGETLRSLPVPLAPPAEQAAILECLGHALADAQETANLVATASARLGALQRSILARAFAG